MKIIKYFIQFIFIIFLFLLFKILGHKLSIYLSSKLFELVGPSFRSKKTISSNLKLAIKNINEDRINKLTKNMWGTYGKIFAEYIYMKKFRNGNLQKNIEIQGLEILKEIEKSKTPVVFVSGHFDNFELMAMQIEKSGIKLSAIYRPLNNIFLNKIMESIRQRYICKNQIKKGIKGLRDLLKLYKQGYSTALMIDQRVSEGVKVSFFEKEALTTSIPAQLVKKFKSQIVPIFIERIDDIKFKMIVSDPITFDKNLSIEEITLKLNKVLEKMILSKPHQWIWSHDRWK